MRKFKSFIVVILVLSFLNCGVVFANDNNSGSTDVNVRVALHWVEGNGVRSEVGDWELYSEGNERKVIERQKYSRTVTNEQLITLKASIQAKGGIITGETSAGYNESGQARIRVTYEVTIEAIQVYDVYKKYRYYYKEELLVDDDGNIYDRCYCSTSYKKILTDTKEKVTGTHV